jgi:hypothetical protein
MRFNMYDAQEALAFLIAQASYIEPEIYRIQYPDILYPQLVPVDTSANEWAKSITYFAIDRVGEADWLSGMANDMRYADVNRAKFEQGLEMAGIGYTYTLEEIGQAMLIPGTNLTAERAEAARRLYEEFVDKLVRNGSAGSASKGLTGLFNNANVAVTTAAATGTGSSTYWKDKTADQIISDVQAAVTTVYDSSLTVEMADTILLPIKAMQLLADTRVPNTYGNALNYLSKFNLYTQMTGQPLTLKSVLNLGNAGTNPADTGRMVAYRRDPRVVKFHLPMPHRFLPVWQTGPTRFDIPGIFRVGSVEVRRPGAFAYVDGITPASPTAGFSH